MKVIVLDGDNEQDREAWALMYTSFNFVDPRTNQPLVPVGTGDRLGHVLSVNDFFDATGVEVNERQRKLKPGVHTKYLVKSAFELLQHAVTDFGGRYIGPRDALIVKHATDLLAAAEEITPEDLERLLGSKDAEEKE